MREQQLEELEHSRRIERVAALSQGEARDIILESDGRATFKEIAHGFVMLNWK